VVLDQHGHVGEGRKFTLLAISDFNE